MDDAPAKPEANDELASKVLDWVTKEGYPAEFRTAATFAGRGFAARQGTYVRPTEETAPREVDVVAYRDLPGKRDRLVRCEFVVECKWSGDKPWVVFTSESNQLHPAACISQTISSELAAAALWKLAAEEACQRLPLFSSPAGAGFGGRQAFSKGNDAFYGALSSVTAAAIGLARDYNRGRVSGKVPTTAVCLFPIVVVDGQLFRAFYEANAGELKVERADHVRCHWRGAHDWEFHATVDVVSLASLDQYLKSKAAAIDKLLKLLNDASDAIAACFDAKSLDPLGTSKAPRGLLGYPKLLQELRRKSLLGARLQRDTRRPNPR